MKILSKLFFVAYYVVAGFLIVALPLFASIGLIYIISQITGASYTVVSAIGVTLVVGIVVCYAIGVSILGDTWSPPRHD